MEDSHIQNALSTLSVSEKSRQVCGEIFNSDYLSDSSMSDEFLVDLSKINNSEVNETSDEFFTPPSTPKTKNGIKHLSSSLSSDSTSTSHSATSHDPEEPSCAVELCKQPENSVLNTTILTTSTISLLSDTLYDNAKHSTVPSDNNISVMSNSAKSSLTPPTSPLPESIRTTNKAAASDNQDPPVRVQPISSSYSQTYTVAEHVNQCVNFSTESGEQSADHLTDEPDDYRANYSERFPVVHPLTELLYYNQHSDLYGSMRKHYAASQTALAKKILSHKLIHHVDYTYQTQSIMQIADKMVWLEWQLGYPGGPGKRMKDSFWSKMDALEKQLERKDRAERERQSKRYYNRQIMSEKKVNNT